MPTRRRRPLAERVYDALLKLFPQEFRGDFGAEMKTVFREERGDAARAGARGPVLRLWLRTVAGMVTTAPAEHLDLLRQDVGFALRTLRRNPGFAASTIVILALGIGANTAVFTAVDSLLLRPLPVTDPARLAVVLEDRGEGSVNHNFSYPDYVDFRDRTRAFTGLVAYSPVEATLATGDGAERIRGEAVSGNFLPVLGVAPRLGRTFLASEDTRAEAADVVIFSDGLWQRLFGSDRSLGARRVVLNGRSFSVVGVLPPSFTGMSVGERATFWVPLMASPHLIDFGTDPRARRGMSWLTLLGRLRPGIGLDAAARDLGAAERQMAADLGLRRRLRLFLAPGHQADSILPRLLFEPLAILAAFVGVVVALVCANVASLLLARASARRREIAMRLALGAGRLRVVRQLLTESVVLALLGGAGGLMAGLWTSGIIARFLAPGEQPLAVAGLDWRVFGFTLGLSLAAGVVFGLAPAAAALRRDVLASVKDAGASGKAGPRRMTVRSLLVVTQVALSLVLLVSAGLLLRTVGNLRGVDVGFTSGRMLLATVDLGAAGYDRPRGLAFCATLVERLRALPGVEAVSLARVAPVAGGGSRTTVAIPGYRPGPDEDMEINFNAVDAGYFRTLGIRLVRGRPFSGADGAASPLVAIVNETMARRHWAGQDPVGRMMGFGERGPFNVQVVGVAPDAKYRTLREEPGPSFYLPLAQMYSGELTLHARTASSGSAFPSLLRHELAALDSRLALSNIRTVDDQLDRAISRERVAANLLTAFGVLALVLSAVGLAGLMAYNVAQRTREFGVRLALGASPLEIRHIVLRRGLALVAAGAIVGAAGSVAATRAIAALLYGVRPFDAMTIAATAALLGGVALLACDVPARRAARLDPVAALRTE